MERNEIYRIYGTNYQEMTMQLLREAGLAKDIILKTGCPDPAAPRIAVKPNLVSPTPASFGATTHPQVVAGLIAYLQEHGFTNIVICEGSWVGDKTEDAFEYCGYHDLADRYGVELFDTQKDASINVSTGGMDLRICQCLEQIDYLINVPVLKGHCQTKVTCALKNMKGLIPNPEKRRFHSMGLHKPIAYLNTVIHQDFILVDHICGDPDFEDGGNPLVTNCILAAKDPVLTDAYACKILGYKTTDVEYIRLAEKLGVGCSNLSSMQLITCNPHVISGIKDDDTAYVHKLLELNYAVDEVESCSACYSALIGALDRLNQEGLLKQLTDQKAIRFCIGQGYRNLNQKQKEDTPCSACQTESNPSQITYVGIGTCTAAFQKNIPGCPPSEDTIYNYLIREI